MPERVTPELITGLTNTKLQTVIVVHCNHANEIDSAVQTAMQHIRQAGITLLNQSVLLKGINDQTTDLINLSRALFHAGILPYYLHLLDKVRGVAHFDVTADTAKHLIHEMMDQLPGYLVPKLVQEQPGKGSKQFVV